VPAGSPALAFDVQPATSQVPRSRPKNDPCKHQRSSLYFMQRTRAAARRSVLLPREESDYVQKPAGAPWFGSSFPPSTYFLCFGLHFERAVAMSNLSNRGLMMRNRSANVREPSTPSALKDATGTPADWPRLQISNAGMSYGKLRVLQDVDFSVSGHEIVSIVGPSGCGKTTLLRCAAGLSSLDEGEVRIDGQVVDRPLPGVSMVFQHFGLFPWKKLTSNIAYGLKLKHVDNKTVERKVAEVVKLVGLEGFEKSYPRQMSGGMCQRAGLARALVMEPRLLLMDEPFSAVDAQTRDILQFELLRIWQERPTAMLFVTHSIDEAVLMGDRVIVLAGRPSHVRAVFDVDLPRPRNRDVFGHPTFIETRDKLWHAIFQ
jgi:NitT/TauT family transport system ATP-binding protein